MKKIALLFLISLLTLFTQANEYAIIKGVVKNRNSISEIILATVRNGEPLKIASTSVSSNGNFAFMFEPTADEPFYYVYDGKAYHRLFVRTGGEIEVLISQKGFQVVAAPDQENQLLEIWRTLKQPLCSFPKDMEYGDFFPRFDSIQSVTKRWIEEIKRTDEKLTMALQEIVELDLLHCFVSYLSKNQTKYDSEEQESAYYSQLIKCLPHQNARLLKQPYGKELLKQYFSYKQTFIHRGREYSLEERLAELNTPELRAEYILSEFPKTDYIAFRDYERRMIPLLPNDCYRQRLRNLPERPTSVLEVGKPAPNLIYADPRKEFHAATDFPGKYKYVDIWATWCAPCKKEIPHLKQLEEEFAGKNIVFISISIDKDREKWLRFVAEQALGGLQLWAGDWAELPAELNVGSVPRFLLIDPEGNWVDVNAPRPSDPALKNLLYQRLNEDD